MLRIKAFRVFIIYMGLNDSCIQLLNRPEWRIYSASICVGKVTVSSTGYGTTPAISLLFHIPSKPLLGWYRNSRLSKVTCTYRCSCRLYSVFVSRWWSKQQGPVSWKLEERLWLPTRKLALFRLHNFLGSGSRNDFTMLHIWPTFTVLTLHITSLQTIPAPYTADALTWGTEAKLSPLTRGF